MITHSMIEQYAAELRRINAHRDQPFEELVAGSDFATGCHGPLEYWDRLSFPGGLESGMVQLQRDDPETVEVAIRLLEVDPRFFRSGYIKQVILQRLKHVTLTLDQSERLGKLIIRSMDGGGRREFRGYARLAGALQHPAVQSAAESRIVHGATAEVVRRAAKVLHVMRSYQSNEDNEKRNEC